MILEKVKCLEGISMKGYIHNKLLELTEEESRLLYDSKEINKEIYTDQSQFIIDSNKLLNIGELIHIRKHTRFVKFPKHKHNFIEFNYVYQGELKQKIYGNEIHLKKGELLFLNQHITHEIEASKEEDIIINFIIKPEFFDYIISLLENDNPVINFLISTLYTNCNEGEYLHFKVSKNKEIQDIVESIIVELYEGNIVSKAKTKLLVGLLLVELVKCADNIDVFSGDNYEKKMLIEILKYIDDNYKDGSLIQISNILKQNDYKISKLIKKHLNCTFKGLLQDKKLSKSAELLTYTNMPITQIIEEVGYENLTYFYKIFKAKYKMTPKDYRNENKKFI